MAYHAGELAVQTRYGVAELADRLGGKMLRGEMPDAVRDFLESQPLVFVSSVDGDDVWASVLHGMPGFVDTLGERTVLARAHAPLIFPGPVGLLALEPATRHRVRVNGTAELTGEGLRVTTEQVYGNCQKYISRREIVGVEPARTRSFERTELAPEDRAQIEAADTFFVATYADGGADMSHRGGNPGFVTVAGDALRFPDYRGNNMFMTLGNLELNPRIGVLFIDWDSGDTLQLTGAAELGDRVVDVRVERAVRTPGALPYRWALIERSRFNP